MAKVGAQRAAELTGRSKSTIQRAMKNGKLSYEVDSNDRRVIDVAELERAFGLLPQDGGASGQKDQSIVEAELEKAAAMLEMERLRLRAKSLEDQLDIVRDQIEDIKGQRDQWQKQAQQVLLTSQYSQKQAEDLKAQVQEMERRAEAQAQRRKEMEQRRAAQQQAAASGRPAGKTARAAATSNENKPMGPIEKLKHESRNFDIQGLWAKIRGAVEHKQAQAAAAAAQENSGRASA
jgi:hypothetical protein